MELRDRACPAALRQAREIGIVTAFVQESGLSRITADLHDALTAGVSVRLATGDYLNIAQADALEAILESRERLAAGPTESGIVFLQQLGRGLRAHAGKIGPILLRSRSFSNPDA
jgi:hypothetical protein